MSGFLDEVTAHKAPQKVFKNRCNCIITHPAGLTLIPFMMSFFF